MRLVALVLLVAGVAKLVDVGLPPETRIRYEPWRLAVLGVVEIAIALYALLRPSARSAFVLVAFFVAVTLYLIWLPPGEREQAGCQCFGSRLRFQDIRAHIRLNGALILVAAACSFGCRASAPRNGGLR